MSQAVHSPEPRAALPHDLGEILLRTTDLTPEQLADARRAQAEGRGRRLGDVLVDEGLVTAEQVLDALSQQLGLPVRPQIGADSVDETLVLRVPIAFAKGHVILPLQRDEDGTVVVLNPDPPADRAEDVRRAALLCPSRAITVED